MTRSRQGPSPAPARRQVKQITAQRLERVALAYLEKYAAPAAGVRRVLQRRVTKAARVHETDSAAAAGWIDDIIARLIRSGLVDDGAYANGRVRSLFRQGRSRRYITGYLNAKGVDRELIETALAALAPQENDFAAALRYARRRRLGPFAPPERANRRDRALGSLGRAGFSYEVARRVAEAESVSELEDEISAANE